MFDRQSYAKACQKALEGYTLPNKIGLDRCGNPRKDGWNRELLERLVKLCKEGYRSFEIAETLGKSPKAIQKVFRRYNMPTLQNICPRRGENNPAWRGGVYKDKNGYSYIRKPDHPCANYNGYVYAHRLIVEEHLGRYLRPNEVVHHIDGNHANNDISNLQVFSSNADHLRQTISGIPHNVSEEGRKTLSKKMSAKWEEWKRSGYSPRKKSHNTSSIQ
jgi:hypothetical protein